jgi:hypothetical protein
MEPTERCAFTSTLAVTLLAIAGFACIVFLPADETIDGWMSARESIDPPSPAASKMAAALTRGGFR